nr:unnamed protein product [Digitaria exilis]
MSELEFEEVKGLQHLDFTFSDAEAYDELASIVLGLRRKWPLAVTAWSPVEVVARPPGTRRRAYGRAVSSSPKHCEELPGSQNYRKDTDILMFLKILGNKYQSKLLEIIDASELPEFLGGTPVHVLNMEAASRIVQSGEVQCARQIVTISNGEEKFISYSKPKHHNVQLIYICFNVEWQTRGSDTSTAESGSKALRTYISHPKLTPVREEVKMVRASSFSTRLPEYDVPVVDKAVDATWKREQPRKTPLPPKDSSLGTATKPSDSSWDKMVAIHMACLMAIVMLVRSILLQRDCHIRSS